MRLVEFLGKINEDQAIRTYDPGVLDWLKKALARPDADELYVHGSRQEATSFDVGNRRSEYSLLYFSKLTDPRFRDLRVPYQAEHYGPKLWLVKLHYKKPFDVRYPDREAARMHQELVGEKASKYRLDFPEVWDVLMPALEKGYDMFVVWEVAASTESYAVPNPDQVEIIDTYDSRDNHSVNEQFGYETSDIKRMFQQRDLPMHLVEMFWEDIGEWIDQHPLVKKLAQPWLEREHVNSASELSPEYWHELPENVRMEYVYDREDMIRQEMMQHSPAEAPTWAHMDYDKQITEPVWLVHFSNDAYEIASKGFIKGIDDPYMLGLTTWFKDDSFAKKYGGYNFAFVADSREARNARYYGDDFVLFINRGGIQAYHYGDEENQVIIWGKSVDPRNMVLVMKEESLFRIKVHPLKQARYDIDFVHEVDEYEHAVGWVEANYDQYRKVITGW